MSGPLALTEIYFDIGLSADDQLTQKARHT